MILVRHAKSVVDATVPAADWVLADGAREAAADLASRPLPDLADLGCGAVTGSLRAAIDMGEDEGDTWIPLHRAGQDEVQRRPGRVAQEFDFVEPTSVQRASKFVNEHICLFVAVCDRFWPIGNLNKVQPSPREPTERTKVSRPSSFSPQIQVNLNLI